MPSKSRCRPCSTRQVQFRSHKVIPASAPGHPPLCSLVGDGMGGWAGPLLNHPGSIGEKLRDERQRNSGEKDSPGGWKLEAGILCIVYIIIEQGQRDKEVVRGKHNKIKSQISQMNHGQLKVPLLKKKYTHTGYWETYRLGETTEN